jgi:nitrous oxidase accessory protein
MTSRCVALILVTLGVQPELRADGVRLQNLVDSARPGDTIFVAPGVYQGNVILNKRVALIGIGAPVVRGDDRGSVVTITADSCTVKGLIIEHCGPMLVEEDAGILVKSSSNHVEGNELRDVLFGIYLLQVEHTTVTGNTISGRAHLDLGERGSGIHVWNSRGNQLVGNKITDVRDGFYIQNASGQRSERNEVSRSRYGLHYMYADSNIFLYNVFHSNVAGAAVMYSRGIRMRHNVFMHNRGFASFGILFQDCHGMEADSNVIADNEVGIFFEATTANRFRHNIIARNDVALQMFQNSIQNVFTENNFIDNLSPLSIVGKRTGSHWNTSGRGNFWSSYEGYDLNDDGIGDIPMSIQNVFQYLEGQNPNLRLYLYSPASQAIAAASRAFPIIAINEERDAYPLMTPFDSRRMPALRLIESEEHTQESSRKDGQRVWLVFPLAGIFAAHFVRLRLKRRGVL